MKKITSLLLICLIYGCFSASVQAQTLQDIRVDLVYLASDYLAGRETGKEGEKMAAAYLSHRFEEMGLLPKGDKDKFTQTFEVEFKKNPHAAEGEIRTAHNVIAYIDNGATHTVVIGAHYDHLGKGAFGSRHKGEPDIHNGADDNASGTAGLLYLAGRLVESELKGNNYLFIGFSGEEMGLFGSKHFVNNPTIDLASINYMLNMDMIGRMDEENNLIINGAGTSPVWKERFEQIEAPDLKIKTTDSGIGASDHTSFYLKDIPSIHFFTGTHDDYHKPQDDSELINFEGLQKVGDWMYALIENLDDQGKLEFSKTKDENTRKASRFKVTLGVMPDYAYSEGDGMRIDAVLDDRPAKKAGIEGGDVIIQIGEVKVKDIYDYMDGLSKYEIGQEAEVKVKRGEEELTYKVVF